MEFFAAVRTELKTVSNPSEELPSKSSSTSLDFYDLEICYNKFLAYYKLPLLREPQTINSFKQHLIQNNAKHLACYQLITVNSNKTEAHVYLPYESEILPNHYVLSIYDSYNISLKLQTNTSIFPSTSSTFFKTNFNLNQSTNNHSSSS